MNSIIFDIGGTKMRITYSVDGETFEEPKVVVTFTKGNENLELLLQTIKSVLNGRKLESIAGGVSRAVFDNYKELKEILEKEFNTKVFVENDASMVGLGEVVNGAGKGYEIVAYITVSTGVGGARIVNGKIDEYSVGFEPGKQIIDIENNKTLEDLISGRALEARTGKNPKEITDPQIWDEHARLLAVGINNIIVEWSPDCIVLGGSMITGEPSIPLDKTEEYLKEILKMPPTIPPIKKAELGDFGGLWGALAYLKTVVK